MPSCFQLTRKGETEPSVLQRVDEAICKHLGEPVDDVVWCHNWYNTIGLGLACGHDWAKLKEIFTDEHKHKIIDFLKANYTTDSWWEHK